MGSEATCRVRFDGKISEGKAHLETEQLLFRGEFRLAIAFKQMQSVEAKDDELHVAFNGKTAILELGKQSAKWADKILNPKSLLDKLGVKAGQRIAVLGVQDESFQQQLENRLGELPLTKPGKEMDLIFFAAKSPKDLEKLAKLEPHLQKKGALWIIFPKGVKRFQDGEVIAGGKAAGLVDTKVVKFSESHSALKFVIPLARRREESYRKSL